MKRKKLYRNWQHVRLAPVRQRGEVPQPEQFARVCGGQPVGGENGILTVYLDAQYLTRDKEGFLDDGLREVPARQVSPLKGRRPPKVDLNK